MLCSSSKICFFIFFWDFFLSEVLFNIVFIILEFPLFEEECPLNFGFSEKELEQQAQDVFYQDEWCEKNCDDNYKKCWLKYFDKLQELKGKNDD